MAKWERVKFGGSGIIPTQTTDHNFSAIIMLLVAALLWSMGAPIIHLTGRGTNPFLFNTFYLISVLGVLSIFLVATWHRWQHLFTHSLPSNSRRGIRPMIISPALFTCYMGSGAGCTVALKQATIKQPSTLLKLPIVWIGISAIDVGVFVWATQYLETAIATAIYELWPAFAVLFLLRHKRTLASYLSQTPCNNETIPHNHYRQILLTMCAGVGVIFVVISQAELANIVSEVLSMEGLFGLLLALLSGMGAGGNVAASLIFGRVAGYRLTEGLGAPTSAERLEMRRDERGKYGHLMLLWLTLLGVVVAWSVMLPFSLIVGVFSSASHGAGVTGIALAGGLILGVADVGSVVLIRVVNSLTHHPTINTISFASPVFALTWLFLLGIAIPQFELFIVGVALILAMNVILQLRPNG